MGSLAEAQQQVLREALREEVEAQELVVVV
jgi:hypothetical protein